MLYYAHPDQARGKEAVTVNGKRKRWFKLDNAAKLYPAVATSRWSSMYRVSALLASPVDKETLQRAVDMVLPRFPAFKVRLKRGFFWFYFEENTAPLYVLHEEGHPCMPLKFSENNGYMLRVLYGKNKISAEFFHALADGTGGLCFIKTLVTQYLNLTGVPVAFDNGALDPKDAPAASEYEDAFQRMPLPKVRTSRKETTAYHLHATREMPHTLNLIVASMPCDKVRALAKAMNVTMTEYLAGVMLYVLYLEAKKEKHAARPIRISIPINMRQYFETRTLRNFSSFVNPWIDPRLGEYTFEEIVKTVHAFLAYYNNPKLLSAIISANVQDERNLLIRLCPLPLKNFVINRVFKSAGDRLISTTLTNLGRVLIPTGGEEAVKRFELCLGAPVTPVCSAAMLSTGNELLLAFSDNILEKTLPRETLRFLVEQGVPVTVESNRE